MRDESTGNWIVFNGEIYNYRELRKELEKRGQIFRSQSDTEVILKAYGEYGAQCVHKLRGMFAFAIVDIRKRNVVLAVDRFGIKPLYVYRKDTMFAFASEIKALLSAGIVPRTLEQDAVRSFLSFGAVQAPLTMIQGVRAMLPGQYLVYDSLDAQMESGFYWTASAMASQSLARPGVEGVGAILEDTVRNHLVADVPIGLFLSGGLDSSALAVLVHRVVGRTLDSFSVTFEEEEFAEGKYARMIGEKFCARHHEITVSDADLQHLLPGALDAQDQPTIDGVNAYVISKVVRDAGIKVVLSGQGGDEVFGGYPTFQRIPQMVKWWSVFRMLPRWQKSLLTQMIGRSSVVRSKLGQYLMSDGDVRSFYAISRQLFSPEQIQRIVLHNDPLSEVEKKMDCFDTFSEVSLLEIRGYLANTLLHDGDVMSMAHGLEVRVPYLDHVLLEYVLSIPEKEKMSGRFPKPLLLNAVRDEMPHEIYDRKKMGFTFPWEIWLRGRLRAEVDVILSDDQAAQAIGVNLKACQNIWRQFLAHNDGITWSRVWGLYVLLRWARTRLL